MLGRWQQDLEGTPLCAAPTEKHFLQILNYLDIKIRAYVKEVNYTTKLKFRRLRHTMF
jgi:hypothetical protein